MKLLLSAVLILGLTGCAVQREYSYTESFDGLGYYRDSGMRVHIQRLQVTPHPIINHSHGYGPAIKPHPNTHKPKHFIEKHGHKHPYHPKFDDKRDDRKHGGVWSDRNDRKPSNHPPKHGHMR